MEKEKHLGSETKRRAVPAIVAMLIVALLLGLVAITVLGGMAFGAIVGSRLQAESMSESSGSISLQSDPDGTGPAGPNLRWASGAGVSARASQSDVRVPTGTTVNQIQLFTRQASANTAVFAIYVDGTAAANRVGTFRPSAGSTWRISTVNLTTAIGPGVHTLHIGPNATFNNNAFVDWFELHNTGSTPPPGGDTTPPETSITSADLGTTNDNTPTFTFTGTDDVGVTGFECRVYASGSPAPAFSNCSSPYTTAALSDGDYVFEVRAKDAAGNVDATPATSSFTVSTTTQGGDTTPPTVVSTVPAANATRVAATTNVMATFSEDMLASSINGTTFKLTKKGSTTTLAAAVSYSASTHTATLDPANSLRSGRTYKAVVTTGAKDLAGNSLDQNSTSSGSQQMAWFFTVR